METELDVPTDCRVERDCLLLLDFLLVFCETFLEFGIFLVDFVGSETFLSLSVFS